MLDFFFSQGINVKIPFRKTGTFDGVLHEGSNSNKVIIEYSIYSLLLSEEVKVKLVFTKKEHDKLSTAILESCEICNDDAVIYSYSNLSLHPRTSFLFGLDSPKRNYLPLKEKCFEFVKFSDLVVKYRTLQREIELDFPHFWDNMREDTKKKYINLYDLIHENKFQEYYEENTRTLTAQRKNDIISFCDQRQRGLYTKYTEDFDIYEKTVETGYFYYSPLLEKMGDLSKEELVNFLNHEFPNEYKDIDNVSFVRKFLESKESTFGNYFKKLELAHLSDYVEIGGNPRKITDFSECYYEIMSLNDIYTQGAKSRYHTKYDRDCGLDYCFHYTDVILNVFFDDFKKECLQPLWYGGMEYVSSSRANIKRLYTFESDDDFSNSLKTYLESGNSEKSFIDKWIKKFGIGESVSFHAIEEGLGAQIRLHKASDDSKGRLLADEGYGITQLVSILLQIELHKTSKNLTVAIEEPEIHLHPKFQSLLADMFVDAYHTYGIHFIIETHSEYLIRRLQLLVAGVDTEEKLNKKDVSIAYIYTKEEADKENQPRVKNISIFENGYLSGTFGKGFFDEATKLSRKLM